MFDGILKSVTATVKGMFVSVECKLDLPDLSTLKGKMKGAVLRGVNRAGKPIRAAVISNAERIKRYGFLAKSVGNKSKVYPNAVVLVIGPKMSFSRMKGKWKRGPRKEQGKRHVPYLYSWLLERGTKRSAKKPFLAPAYASAGAQFAASVRQEIAAELRALNTKTKG